jgi:hypothetical protein
VLLAYNRRDFTMLHDAWVSWPQAFGLQLPAHPGILVLDPATPAMLAEAIISFVDSTPAETLANGLFWWQRRGVWYRRIVQRGWELCR